MNVLGYGNITNDDLISDFILPNKEWEIDADEVGETTIKDYFTSGNQDIFIGGDRSGLVLELEKGSADLGDEIELKIESASWNFYKDEGAQSQFGYIDFYVDANANCTFTVFFYKDLDVDFYASQSVDCLPDLGFIADVNDIELPVSVVISDITTGVTPPVVTVTDTDNFSDGDQITIKGVTGTTEVNDLFFLVGNKTATTFELQNLDGEDIDGTNLTAYVANGLVWTLPLISASNHGLVSGDKVYIYGVQGTDEMNNREITVTFNVIQDQINTFRASEVDASAFTAYINGGKVVRNRFTTRRVWKRAYARGIGFQHRIRITESSDNVEFRIHAWRLWAKKIGVRQLG